MADRTTFPEHSVATQTAESDRLGLAASLALTLPFLLLMLVQLIHHQMWVDEINAYGLAVANPTLGRLLHAIHYEGHPWLWYVLLWMLARITPNPEAIKLLQFAVSTGIILLIGVWSPFKWWERILLLASYFISFEYTVMSRMYGLVVLLALLYIRRRVQAREQPIGSAVLLGLMACADLFGCLVSFALAVEYVYSVWQDRSKTVPAHRMFKKLFGAFAIYAALGLSAVFSMVPAKDISTPLVAHNVGFSRAQAARVLVSYVVKPYFPTVTGRPGYFWIPSTAAHATLFAACVPLILLAYWWVFRRQGSLLLMMGTSLFVMLCVGEFVYYGSVRHFGMTFVTFVLGLWMLRGLGERIAWPAYVLIGLTVLGGVDAAIESWQRPFSQAEATAAWIRQNTPPDAPLAGYPVYTTPEVAQLLDRPMYLLQCGCVESYFVFKKGFEGFTRADIPGGLLRAWQYGGGKRMTFVEGEPLQPADLAAITNVGLRAQPMAQFTGAEAPGEDFYLYSVDSVER